MSGVYTFLPWVRQGLSGAGLPPDTLTGDLAGSTTIPIELKINENAPIPNPVRIAGPADVLGIDPRQVVRCDPPRYTRNFEPNFLAAIEFDRPDFPWMFTPASANATAQLRPWICLIVVENRDGVQLRSVQGQPQLRLLEIDDPADELPDLKDSWAWAHSQVAGALENADSLDNILKSSPERTVSRLICPRRLEPNTSYIACVVPTFREQEQTLKPSWQVDDPSLRSLTLPVYYSWEFSTGPLGDFQSLVEKLSPAPAPGLGVRDMLVNGEVLTFEGALRAPDTTSIGFSNGAGTAYRAELRDLVNATAADNPVVAPPIYGGKYSDVVRLPEDNAPAGWLKDLNLDPRYRAIAALGTRIVQIQQESLMADAWEQAGAVERANAILRNAQLLRAASSSIYHRHFNKLSRSSVLEVSRPVHGRVTINSAIDSPTDRVAVSTVDAEIPKTKTPVSLMTSAFRRVARPRGPIMRGVASSAGRPPMPIIESVDQGMLNVDSTPPLSEIFIDNFEENVQIDISKVGIVTLELTETHFKNNGGHHRTVSYENIANRPLQGDPAPGFQIAFSPLYPGNQPGTATHTDNEGANRFRAALAAHQPLIALPAETQAVVAFRSIDTLADDLLKELDPAETVPKLVRPMIEVEDSVQIITPPSGQDNLEPLELKPQFPQPMYASILDFSQELFMPGLESVKEDSILMLEPNPRFIEAFMAGLNHEIGRELVWRGYPAHTLNTPFLYFWNTEGRTGGPGNGDIKPMEQWQSNQTLGNNAVGFAKPLPVLFIRSELFRRYPTAIIYAVRASWADGRPQLTPGAEEKYPFFHGSLNPDIKFFGFSIPSRAVVGDKTPGQPGYFFVIQEHPTEPRFGVEASDPSTDHLKPLGNAAETAKRLLQQPVRIAIHARDLLRMN